MGAYNLTPDNEERLIRWAKARKQTAEEALNALVLRYMSRRPAGQRKDGRIPISQLVVDLEGNPLSIAEASRKYGIPERVLRERKANWLLGEELFAPYP